MHDSFGRDEPHSVPQPRIAVPLVVQADDGGMCASINDGIAHAIEADAVDAVGIMVPCEEAAGLVSCAHEFGEQVDFGLHVTLTCEATSNRWGPVVSTSRVPSLVLRDGTFARTAAEFAERASRDEVLIEIVGQYKRGKELGYSFAYMDCHMFAAYQRTDLFDALATASRWLGLPLLHDVSRAPANRTKAAVSVGRLGVKVGAGVTVRFVRDGAPEPAKWFMEYTHRLVAQRAYPLTQLLLHPGVDGFDLREMLGIDSPYGAAWRARDLAYALDLQALSICSRVGLARARWSTLVESGKTAGVDIFSGRSAW